MKDLVRYLKSTPITYDQIHTICEPKGKEIEVEHGLAQILIKNGSVEEVNSTMPEKEVVEEKMVDVYEDKQIKPYENKAVKSTRGRPKSKK